MKIKGEETRKKLLTPTQKAEQSVRFFNEKLKRANSSTPQKHIKKWAKKLAAAHVHLSTLMQGAG